MQVPRFSKFCLWLSLFVFAPGLMAQEELTPQAEESERVFLFPKLEADQQRHIVTAPLAPPLATKEYSPFRWGPVLVRPHVLYQFLNGDGIQLQPGVPLSTTLNTFAPGLQFELGDNWHLDYTPSLKYYSNQQFRDTLDHRVLLDGTVPMEDWVFGFAQLYQASSEPLVETGAQTDQEVFSTDVTARYKVGTSVGIELGVSQYIRNVVEFSSSRTWSTLDWLNYQLTREVALGVGAGFGFVSVEKGSDMTYEQIQGRAKIKLARKLDLTVTGGVDIRQFLDAHNSDGADPIFGVSLEHHPFDQTQISLHARRFFNVSYFGSEFVENTDVGLGLRQRLLGKLFLEIEPGYRFQKYFNTGAGALEARHDDGWYLNTRLSCAFLRRGRIAVFWQRSENTSSQSEFSYRSTQTGVEVGFSL